MNRSDPSLSDPPKTLPAGLTPQLMQWVQSQLLAGLSHDAMLQAMRDVGWSQALAQAALNCAEPVAPATTVTAARQQNPAQAEPQQGADRAQQPLVQRPIRPGPIPEPDLREHPSSVDVGDRLVHVLVEMPHPRVVVFANLLSPEECDAIIAAAKPRMARSLTVAMQNGGEEVNDDRTSNGMFFQRGEMDVVRRLEARIAQLVNWPVENGEGLQVLHYRPGAEYKPHHDYFSPLEPGTPTLLRRGGQRVATLVIYLNEPEAGGATVFPEVPLQVVPRRGNAVFFSYARPDPATLTLHGGCPVGAGEKWIATKWLREQEFK